MLNILGIEDRVKAFEEKLVKAVMSVDEIPNEWDAFESFMGSFADGNDLDLLEEMESMNGDEECNTWLVNLLVGTGRFVHAGKGYVDIKRSDDAEQTSS